MKTEMKGKALFATVAVIMMLVSAVIITDNADDSDGASNVYYVYIDGGYFGAAPETTLSGGTWAKVSAEDMKAAGILGTKVVYDESKYDPMVNSYGYVGALNGHAYDWSLGETIAYFYWDAANDNFVAVASGSEIPNGGILLVVADSCSFGPAPDYEATYTICTASNLAAFATENIENDMLKSTVAYKDSSYKVDGLDTICYTSSDSVTITYRATTSVSGINFKLTYSTAEFSSAILTKVAAFETWQPNTSAAGEAIVFGSLTGEEIAAGSDLFTITLKLADGITNGNYFVYQTYKVSDTNNGSYTTGGTNYNDKAALSIVKITVSDLGNCEIAAGETSYTSADKSATYVIGNDEDKVIFTYDTSAFTYAGVYKYTTNMGGYYDLCAPESVSDAYGTVMVMGEAGDKILLSLKAKETAVPGDYIVKANGSDVFAYSIKSSATVFSTISEYKYLESVGYKKSVIGVYAANAPDFAAFTIVMDITLAYEAEPLVIGNGNFLITSNFIGSILTVTMAKECDTDLNGLLFEVYGATSMELVTVVLQDEDGNVISCQKKTEVDLDDLYSTKILGDVNNDGNVNMLDLIVLMKYLAGYDVEINKANANLDGSVDQYGNKTITIADAQLLATRLTVPSVTYTVTYTTGSTGSISNPVREYPIGIDMVLPLASDVTTTDGTVLAYWTATVGAAETQFQPGESVQVLSNMEFTAVLAYKATVGLQNTPGATETKHNDTFRTCFPDPKYWIGTGQPTSLSQFTSFGITTDYNDPQITVLVPKGQNIYFFLDCNEGYTGESVYQTDGYVMIEGKAVYYIQNMSKDYTNNYMCYDSTVKFTGSNYTVSCKGAWGYGAIPAGTAPEDVNQSTNYDRLSQTYTLTPAFGCVFTSVKATGMFGDETTISEHNIELDADNKFTLAGIRSAVTVAVVCEKSVNFKSLLFGNMPTMNVEYVLSNDSQAPATGYMAMAAAEMANPLLFGTYSKVYFKLTATADFDVSVKLGDDTITTGSVYCIDASDIKAISALISIKNDFTASGDLTINGNVTVKTGKTFTVPASTAVTVDANGSLTLESGAAMSVAGTVTDYGSLSFYKGGVTTSGDGSIIAWKANAKVFISGNEWIGPNSIDLKANNSKVIVKTNASGGMDVTASGTMGVHNDVVFGPTDKVTINNSAYVSVLSGATMEFMQGGKLVFNDGMNGGLYVYGTLKVYKADSSNGGFDNVIKVGAGGTLIVDGNEMFGTNSISIAKTNDALPDDFCTVSVYKDSTMTPDGFVYDFMNSAASYTVVSDMTLVDGDYIYMMQPLSVSAGKTMTINGTVNLASGAATFTVSGSIAGTGSVLMRNGSSLDIGITGSTMNSTVSSIVVNSGASVSCGSTKLIGGSDAMVKLTSGKLTLGYIVSPAGTSYVLEGNATIDAPQGWFKSTDTFTVSNGATLNVTNMYVPSESQVTNNGTINGTIIYG